jgi:hypothetical protein
MGTIISITNVLLLTAVLSPLCSSAAMGRSSDTQSQTEGVIDKITARLAEENFWGSQPLTKTELQLVLFVKSEKVSEPHFDVLVVIPDVLRTFEIRNCGREPAIILKGWGQSDSRKNEPRAYLDDEMRRYAGFVQHAQKLERSIRIDSDPISFPHVDSSLRDKRIEQIRLALGDLILKRPLQIRIANFSKFTDQIDVLVPALGDMYTMSVVHTSCNDETVQVGRRYPLKSVRPDLREKIERYSMVSAIK